MKKDFWKQDIFKVPNLLSILRLILIPVFLWIYLTAEEQPWFIVSAVVLALSGLTDMLDGIIARKYNMITQLGKVLDPIADKVTQVSVCVALWIRYPELIVLVIVMVLKELTMMAGGLVLFHKKVKLDGSRWYGKVATTIFYILMFAIVVSSTVPPWFLIATDVIIIAVMVFALIMYIPVFVMLFRKGDKKAVPEEGNVAD
ncbi:MAG: CDP-alcohol phosphatidyltransferase family protein [Oscillospiraceae bacterium]|nr:CDP-alcohol phosphatidyltransferase family protein [Oscillospiraceae bacterium]